ncbi:MAG TPA: Shedu immune nuclease family protein [Gammaproteobacteria bacterium]|nr:Shedu immune nuclease family protein [Gammaproteobacteria bacterium]
MKKIQTRSTSARTAESEPIVLRETDRVRLVFMPLLIDNAENPHAAVKGSFVYQRKGSNDKWLSLNTESLGTIKKGETYKLELHSDEVFRLGDGLRPLFELMRAQGLPRGEQEFVRVDDDIARVLTLSGADLATLLDARPDNAVAVLVKLIRWLADSDGRPNVTDRLEALASSELPSVASLLSLVALKQAISEWRENQNNPSEDYWQKLLAKHASVLSHVFSYPVVIIGEKAYVGGKRLDNTGGRVTDFLGKAALTDGLVVIEIKTPTTELLGTKYRSVYPLSVELNGAIAQVLRYRQELTKGFSTFVENATSPLTLGEPRCVVIAGNVSAELEDTERKNSFELLRERISGVTVIAFDELFSRVERSIGLLTAQE